MINNMLSFKVPNPESAEFPKQFTIDELEDLSSKSLTLKSDQKQKNEYYLSVNSKAGLGNID